MTTKGKRSALLVGCNYPDTQQELHGCYNDVQVMHTQLTKHFGFAEKDIKTMIDAPDSLVMPTGANIRNALVLMIFKAKPGDTLFFFFSGYGTLYNDSNPAIVSSDIDKIKDCEFQLLVNYLPKGATFTFLADASHSGGLKVNPKEQKIRDFNGPEPEKGWEKNYRLKTLPKNVKSTVQPSNIGSSDISAHLSEVFGTRVTANLSSANSRPGGPPTPSDDGILPSDDGILLSSCNQIENSVEAYPKDNRFEAYGAFTNAVETVLNKHEGKITNRELVTLARDFLRFEGNGQHPCLFSSDKNADALFLGYKTA